MGGGREGISGCWWSREAGLSSHTYYVLQGCANSGYYTCLAFCLRGYQNMPPLPPLDTFLAFINGGGGEGGEMELQLRSKKRRIAIFSFSRMTKKISRPQREESARDEMRDVRKKGQDGVCKKRGQLSSAGKKLDIL